MDKLKEQKAIARLKAFEPADGYRLAYSGGKDSEGAGTENDPCREVIQYWTLDGELIVTRSQYEEGKR